MQSLSPASVSLTIEKNRTPQRSRSTLHYVGGEPSNVVVGLAARAIPATVTRSGSDVAARASKRRFASTSRWPTSQKPSTKWYARSPVNAQGARDRRIANVAPNLVRVKCTSSLGTGVQPTK